MALVWNEIKGWHVSDEEPMSFDDWELKKNYLYDLWTSTPFEHGKKSEAWLIYHKHYDDYPQYTARALGGQN